MKVNEKGIERLTNKIKKLENELQISQERLRKMKPCEPLTHDNTKYDNKKKELLHLFEYFCPYCGEKIYKPKSKKTIKHKCGQMILWE